MENQTRYVNRNYKSNPNNYYYVDKDAAAWIINFGNMDYLKTSDGTTCPNNTKLTSGGNHTCK